VVHLEALRPTWNVRDRAGVEIKKAMRVVSGVIGE
jgi:hypothetical protein